jgi:hypothetical protein
MFINKKGRGIIDTIQKHDVEEVFNVGPSKMKMVYQRFGDSASPITQSDWVSKVSVRRGLCCPKCRTCMGS